MSEGLVTDSVSASHVSAPVNATLPDARALLPSSDRCGVLPGKITVTGQPFTVIFPGERMPGAWGTAQPCRCAGTVIAVCVTAGTASRRVRGGRPGGSAPPAGFPAGRAGLAAAPPPGTSPVDPAPDSGARSSCRVAHPLCDNSRPARTLSGLALARPARPEGVPLKT